MVDESQSHTQPHIGLLEFGGGEAGRHYCQHQVGDFAAHLIGDAINLGSQTLRTACLCFISVRGIGSGGVGRGLGALGRNVGGAGRVDRGFHR